MTFDLLGWLSADQMRYVVVSQIGVFSFALLVAIGACSDRLAAFLATRRGTVAFFAVTCVAFLTSRWPTLFMGLEELNRDQADFIAAALTAIHHPVPWRDFDPLTSGPFNVYVLMLPLLVGRMPTFLTTSILTLAMQMLTIAALYGALERCFDARVARLGLVAPVVFLCVTVQAEYLQYATETLSVLVCAIVVWLLARAWRRGFPARSMFAIGVLCGALPFAKLQSAPLSAVLAIATYAVLGFANALSPGERLRRVGVTTIGLALVPCISVVTLAAFGVLGDFWTSYVGSAIGYVNLPEYRPLTYVVAAVEFGRYFDFSLGITCIGLVVVVLRRRSAGVRDGVIFTVAIAILAGALYCIFTPRRGTVGYLNYAIVPVATTAAVALATISRALGGRVAVAAVSVAFIAAALAFDGGFVRASNFWSVMAYPTYRQGGDPDPLVTMIEGRLNPGERLAVWGYHPEYVIYTQTILGTRDPNTFDQFTTSFNPNRYYYRMRFIGDMRANRPEGFLDAGTASFDRDGTSASIYEAWTELAAIVDADYVLVGQWHRYRFYIRRDLAHRKRERPPVSG